MLCYRVGWYLVLCSTLSRVSGCWKCWRPSEPTQQLADAQQLSLWRPAAAAIVRVSPESSAKSEPEYRGPVCQNWSGGESVPVPARTEATVGPSLSLRAACIQLPRGPQHSCRRRGGVSRICKKRLSRVAKKELKGFLNVIDRCRIALEVLSVATKVG